MFKSSKTAPENRAETVGSYSNAYHTNTDPTANKTPVRKANLQKRATTNSNIHIRRDDEQLRPIVTLPSGKNYPPRSRTMKSRGVKFDAQSNALGV